MRRNVKLVVEEPSIRQGKPRLFGYGYEAIAVLKRLPVWTVRRHARKGVFQIDSLLSVLEYVKRVD